MTISYAQLRESRPHKWLEDIRIVRPHPDWY